MLTGNLGKPHAGVNPVRGQNNVQGACDMGALPDTYPAARPYRRHPVRCSDHEPGLHPHVAYRGYRSASRGWSE
ncbi:hypothetical protein AWE23_00010, partial [Escherichia coli]